MPTVVAGRYELRAAVGRGASGEVWHAQDRTLDRPVAVKLVKTPMADPDQLRRTADRFAREVHAVARLNHPNVAAAYDSGRDGDTLYLVTEFVDGQSFAALLRDRIRAGADPFPIDAALEVAEQVCAGLAAAHAAGIVHRDLKPANLMISANATVKIIDFGIAFVIASSMPRLTIPGTMVGTLAYSAPEQFNDMLVDGRTDLYALGCLLYEAVAGARPFEAERFEALFHKRLMSKVRPIVEVRPDTPPEVADLINDLMQMDPASRPPSAKATKDRIRLIKAARRRAAHPPPAPSRTPPAPPLMPPAPPVAADPVAVTPSRGTPSTPARPDTPASTGTPAPGPVIAGRSAADPMRPVSPAHMVVPGPTVVDPAPGAGSGPDPRTIPTGPGDPMVPAEPPMPMPMPVPMPALMPVAVPVATPLQRTTVAGPEVASIWRASAAVTSAPVRRSPKAALIWSAVAIVVVAVLVLIAVA